MSKKKNTEIVILKSTKSNHFYTVKKNKKLKLIKLNIKKYDPYIRKHVIYSEKR